MVETGPESRYRGIASGTKQSTTLSPADYRYQGIFHRNRSAARCRRAGDPMQLAPKWITPPIVVVTSPKGAHDVLGRTDGFVDKALPIFDEVRRILGGNVFDFTHEAWLPRRRALQPVFTKQQSPSSPGIWPRPPKGFQCVG